MKKLLSIVLVVLMIFSIPLNEISNSSQFECTKVVKAEESDIIRYTVLILDTSGSMKGKPAEVQRDAAKAFCKAVLNSEGTNYVAIVNLNKESTLGLTFIRSLSTLENYIDSIPEDGGTNINQALEIAGKLIDSIEDTGSNVIKNVVLCSDGLPESGEETENGPYTESDYAGFANKAYNTAKDLMNKCTLYTLGFFHSLKGETLDFGRTFLADIASDSSKYYEVTDTNDLKFMFGTIAQDVITENSSSEELMNEFVEEHKKYYQTSYANDIVPMSRTVGLGFMLDDASEDLGNLIYSGISEITTTANFILSTLKISSYINIDFKGKKLSFSVPDNMMQDLGSSEYSMILYQLMASDDVYNGIVDTFYNNYQKNLCGILSKLANDIADSTTGIDLIKDEYEASYNEIKETMRVALEWHKEAEYGSEAHKAASALWKSTVLESYDIKKVKNILEKRSNSINNTFTFIGATLDGINTVKEGIAYICWAESYAETTEMFRKVLIDVAAKADDRAKTLYITDPGGEGSAVKAYSESSMCLGLSKAINSFIENMNTYAEDVNKAFVNTVVDGIGNTGLDLCVDAFQDVVEDKLLGGILFMPYLTILNVGLNGGKFLIDAVTNIDDQYKRVLSVKSLNIITRMLREVSDSYGKALLFDTQLSMTQPGVVEKISIQNQFTKALYFDESINIYRNAIKLACNFGVKYEEARLKINAKLANAMPKNWYKAGASTEWQKQASASSTAIHLLEFQKIETNNIKCHSSYLQYNKYTKVVEYNGHGRKVIVIACPVDVTVSSSNGSQLAYLTDNDAKVQSGYEPYFDVIPYEGDSIKVVTLPEEDGYKVSINGTGNGTMNVFVSKYENGKISDTEVFANFDVTDDTVASLDNGDTDNKLGYLKLDGITYGKEDDNKDNSNASSSSKPITVSTSNTKISLGSEHSGFIDSNGNLYTWGLLIRETSDTGTYISYPNKIPVQTMDNVYKIALGDDYTAVIKKDKSLYMWGKNIDGQLGDGTNVNSIIPKQIMSNVTQVSIGSGHSGAITENGELYMWGSNNFGQLGDGTTIDKDRPVKIMDNVVQISVGGIHSAAITSDGSLYMWGSNRYGQLGDGTIVNKNTPTKIMDNVIKVSLGGNIYSSGTGTDYDWCDHSAAITSDGSLYMWGSNIYGQLGNGSTENSYKPIKIMDNISEVSLGDRHSGAITKSGDLYTWGQNDKGQLGNGNTSISTVPVNVLNNAIELSLGSGHSGAITKDGSIYMWGDNNGGKLGDGTTDNSFIPKKITILTSVKSIPSPSPTAQFGNVNQPISTNIPFYNDSYNTPQPTTQPISSGDSESNTTPNYNYNFDYPSSTGQSSSFGSYTNTSNSTNYNKITKLSKLKKPKIKNLKSPKKRTLNIKWKQVKRAKGYEIRYSTKKKMSIYNAIKTTKKKLKIKGLQSSKKYYVKIRAYTTKNGKTVYSKWSNKRKVWIK